MSEGEVFYHSPANTGGMVGNGTTDERMVGICIKCHKRWARVLSLCVECNAEESRNQAELPPLGESVGLKFDNGKADWSLLELEFVEPLVAVFEIGEKRYGFENWKKDFDNEKRRFQSAIKRHTLAIEKHGPAARNEEDGNVYHAAQIAWNALRLLWGELKRQEADNGDQSL